MSREPRFTRVDLAHVQATAGWQRARMRAYADAVNDPEKDARLKARQCVLCYYVTGRAGGAVCTTARCGMADCPELIHSGNTCVDVLCPGCAARHRLCVHCGGDVDLKARRKL